MKVLGSDVGLWVMDSGSLHLNGHRRTGWLRARGPIQRGAREIELRGDPKGWRVGDELAITPTLPPTRKNASDAYDYARITAINGRKIRLSKAARFHHPAVRVGRGKRFTAEILNLTRNVRIEGTKTGRSHIFIHSHRKQFLRFAQVRYMGPRQSDGGGTKFVLGRYGIHFHHAQARGSKVIGTVGRDCGSHVFVPHFSDRVTFFDCVSHNTFEDAYWWDPDPEQKGMRPDPSNGIRWSRCVASRVHADPGSKSRFTLAGFTLGHGKNNTAVRCVAAGVQGTGDASGFKWPTSTPRGVWDFRDCVSHNNTKHGVWVWQNTDKLHEIIRLVGYHNGVSGVAHGAYRNHYVYKDCILFGNLFSAIEVHAQSARAGKLRWIGMLCDGGGLSDYAVVVTTHILPPMEGKPVTFRDSTFKGFKQAAIGFTHFPKDSGPEPELMDFIDCTFRGNEFWFSDKLHVDSLVRVQDARHGALGLKRSDQIVWGDLNREWNARVKRVRHFA